MSLPAVLRRAALWLAATNMDPAERVRAEQFLRDQAAQLDAPRPLRFSVAAGIVAIGREGEPLVEHACDLRGATLAHQVLASPAGVALPVWTSDKAARNARNRFAAWAERLGDDGRDLAAAVRSIEVLAGPVRARVRPGARRCAILAT